ncbi:MAG: hypothetical protein U0Y68_02800 [Blastocatellia bacterium]
MLSPSFHLCFGARWSKRNPFDVLACVEAAVRNFVLALTYHSSSNVLPVAYWPDRKSGCEKVAAIDPVARVLNVALRIHKARRQMRFVNHNQTVLR